MSPMKRASTVDGLKRGIGTAAPVSDSAVRNLPLQGEDLTAADEPKAEKWPARISMTASRDMKRQLEQARLDDGIEVTARLRAMITLWLDDPQLRARVDELARALR
jgi:hypothetical protein